MDRLSDKHLVLCICLALALSTVAAYWPLRHNDFISFDDQAYIVKNDHVTPGLTRQGLLWAFTEAHAYNWHPLTWLSHMLDCQLFRLDAGRHHLTNMLFHTANAVLMFLIIKRMTGNLWASAFVAALFALHPLHVESVAWASERKDVLSTFFWILTTWAYIRYVERPTSPRYILILLFFALGLLAKQMPVTLPFVLLLLDYWPLKRFSFEKRSLATSEPPAVSVPIRRCVIEKLPLFVLSVVASVTVFLVQQGTAVMKSMIEYPLLYRAGNALVAYVLYIGKMLWPTHLAIFYPHLGHKLPAWQVVTSALLLLSITTAVIYKLRRRPYLAVGWFWYLGMLVPVIGLVQVGNQALADRYTYVPLTGLFIIIAWAIPDLLSRLPYRRALIAASAIVVLSVLAVMTRFQVGTWRNDTTLYEHATQVVPDNWWAHHRVAQLLDQQDNLDQAIVQYNKSLQIEPNNPYALNNLGLALVRQGRLDQAITHFARALLLKPDRSDVRVNLGAALAQQGRLEDAAVQFKEALRIDPDAYKVHHNLGVLLVDQNQLDEAVTHFEDALRIKPDFADAHLNLGIVLGQQGKLEEAINHYAEALQIDPNSSQARENLADAHNTLGIALGRQGKLDKAVVHFTSALTVRPKLATAHSNLGYVLFLQGNSDQALISYSQALRIDPNLVSAHCNIALVLEKERKMDEAIKQYRKALEISPDYTRARHALQRLLKQNKPTQ